MPLDPLLLEHLYLFNEEDDDDKDGDRQGKEGSVLVVCAGRVEGQEQGHEQEEELGFDGKTLASESESEPESEGPAEARGREVSVDEGITMLETVDASAPVPVPEIDPGASFEQALAPVAAPIPEAGLGLAGSATGGGGAPDVVTKVPEECGSVAFPLEDQVGNKGLRKCIVMRTWGRVKRKVGEMGRDMRA
jgi:hypothetical protein